jgi:hypothetical protein
VPTPFVGIHAALAILIALFGLSFIVDPCFGGGDLCLGGVLGLFTLGAAGFGAIGIGIWLAMRRASLLFVWDCALVALAGGILVSTSGEGPLMTTLGLPLVLLLALPGAALAGRAVAANRIETVVVVVLLVGVAAYIGPDGGIAALAIGLVALGAGWLLRSREGSGLSAR